MFIVIEGTMRERDRFIIRRRKTTAALKDSFEFGFEGKWWEVLFGFDQNVTELKIDSRIFQFSDYKNQFEHKFIF